MRDGCKKTRKRMPGVSRRAKEPAEPVSGKPRQTDLGRTEAHGTKEVDGRMQQTREVAPLPPPRGGGGLTRTLRRNVGVAFSHWEDSAVPGSGMTSSRGLGIAGKRKTLLPGLRRNGPGS